MVKFVGKRPPFTIMDTVIAGAGFVPRVQTLKHGDGGGVSSPPSLAFIS